MGREVDISVSAQVNPALGQLGTKGKWLAF